MQYNNLIWLSSSNTVCLHIHPESQIKENSVTFKGHSCVLLTLIPSVLSFGTWVYPGCVFFIKNKNKTNTKIQRLLYTYTFLNKFKSINRRQIIVSFNFCVKYILNLDMIATYTKYYLYRYVLNGREVDRYSGVLFGGLDWWSGCRRNRISC